MSLDAHARTRQAIDAVWRHESAKIIAAVARMVRDVGLAEELAQDALVSALEHWPGDGVPDNPGAWLMTTAKRRALDRLRQHTLHARKQEEFGADLEALGADHTPDIAEAVAEAQADDIGDDLLRLIFTACHPVLTADARVALTLRMLGGLSTDEIARAFLATEPTIAQRIVRAKRTLSNAQVPFEMPDAAARPERLASVLEVIYLIFNEGHAATAGDDWVRPALCQEALRLVRLLASLMPAEPEALALQALLELQSSRLPARIDDAGRPVLLMDQDRSRWDASLIAAGLRSLEQSFDATQALGRQAGPYALQAAIAAQHARAAQAQDTDWRGIVACYDALLAMQPSPVVALNRAVAVGMADGPAAALPLVDALLGERALADYPWLHAARGDLLARLARHAEAAQAFRTAAGLTRNNVDRGVMQQRADAADRAAAGAPGHG